MARTIGDILVEQGRITRDQIKTALEEQERSYEKLGVILQRLRFVSEADIAQARAVQLNIPFVDLPAYPIDPQAVKLIPEKIAHLHGILPIKVTGSVVTLAMIDPLNLIAKDDVERMTGKKVSPVMVYKADIQEATKKSYHVSESLVEVVDRIKAPESVEILTEMAAEGAKESEPGQNTSVISLVDTIITKAVWEGATDIHIEPQEINVMVRYRIDGLLIEKMRIPKWIQAPVISRIKIISNMDIAEKRLPQDGRALLKVSDKKVDLRVSTIPTMFGEKIVLRILNKSTGLFSLDRLGLSPEQVKILKAMLDKPQGVILVTGPTGSGKTTALYASLQEIKSSSMNIITVEDPIEYEVAGVNQVQVNPKYGLSFANGLRSILRQDPDLIMIGEVRDRETAEIAFQASLTGHLVLTTIHTNDAPSTITRLMDIGMEPYLMSSAMIGIMAQRLVRMICSGCKEPYSPDPALLKAYRLEEGTHPYLHGRGCDACRFTGYRGRTGLFEILIVDDLLKSMITSRAHEATLREKARLMGMKTLVEDGQAKVRAGVTTVEELARVLSSEERTSSLCPTCGQPVSSSGICPSCNASATHRCATCALPLSEDWILCPRCGDTALKTPGGAFPSHRIRRTVPAEMRPGAKTKVLFIDDDPAVGEIVRTVFENEGYEVNICETIKATLQTLYRFLPDLILMDIRLPDGSGFDLCKKIKSNLATAFIPVILLTAVDTGTEDKLRGFDVGADDFLNKPFDSRELLARASHILKLTH